MRHVVMFSGGLGSWMTAKRIADQYGTDDLVLLFADVKGDSTSPHVGEDEDAYRFIVEAAANIFGRTVDLSQPTPDSFIDQAREEVAADEDGDPGDAVTHARYLWLRDLAARWVPELIWLREGRNIWQVFHDDRFLGNSRLANCSKFLKQKPCRDWLAAHCDPADTTLYVGLDWSEPHRIPANRLGYAHSFQRPCVDIKACLAYINGVADAKPCKRHLGERAWRVEFPMTEKPYRDKAQMMAACEAEGIEIPRLYRAGFAHNNCAGFCVRGGQAQQELMLREHPARYAYHEKKEQELREYLGKDVTVLKDRQRSAFGVGDDNARPLTLRAFRERLEAQPSMFDHFDVGGCGCMTEDVPS